MIGILGIIVVIVFAVLAYHYAIADTKTSPLNSNKVTDRVGKLWDVTHQSMREKRFEKAEKALLTILKIDEKNAAAYNRLGILYAKQKEYKDALDCFEIASSIEPTPSSLHNLGLIYFDTENYDKAAVAFEQALKLEEDMATRHIAYAKVLERIGNNKLMLSELKRAVELEPSEEAYSLLHKAFVAGGNMPEADMVEQEMKKFAKAAKPRSKRVARPRRVVV